MARVEESRKVTIVCSDNFIIKGQVNIVHGVRLEDFINKCDRFIAVSVVEFLEPIGVTSFKLTGKSHKKKERILLNKDYIKFIE